MLVNANRRLLVTKYTISCQRLTESPQVPGQYSPRSRPVQTRQRSNTAQERPFALRCITPKACETFIFFRLRPHWVKAKKSRFPSYFTYENGAMAGGGIEPPTRGFSVHCSTN